MCIIGDFNHKEIKWNQYCVEGSENFQAAKYFDVTQDLYLFQHVCDATRVRTGQRPSDIDLVLTNEQFMVDEVQIYSPLGKSDHATLFWILYLANKIKKGVTQGLSVNLNFRGANITSISKHFQSIDRKQKLEGLNIDEAWGIFHKEYNEVLTLHVPKRRNKEPKQCPWMKSSVQKALKKKGHL